MLTFLAFLLNLGLFFYVVGAGSLLILTRWVPGLSLFPWSQLGSNVLAAYLLELRQLPQFLGLLVLPGCLFMILQLRGLAKNV